MSGGYVYKTHARDGDRSLCRERSARVFSRDISEITCRGCLEILGVMYTCPACAKHVRGPRAWFDHVQVHCACFARETALRFTHRPPRYHEKGCPALEVARNGGRA